MEQFLHFSKYPLSIIHPLSNSIQNLPTNQPASTLLAEIKYLRDESRTKNCRIKTLLKNQKLMLHPTTSSTMKKDFDKTKNSESVIPKKKARNKKQEPIKTFSFESSCRSKPLV